MWIGRASVEVRDALGVQEIGDELLALATAARAIHGERLDWRDQGGAMWERARSICEDDATAQALVFAIMHHANNMHWGHTFTGLAAIWRNEIDVAIAHLRRSKPVGSDPRLASYGPSFLLVRELAIRQHWDSVVEYLLACQAFWNPEQMATWIAMAQRGEFGDFPEQ